MPEMNLVIDALKNGIKQMKDFNSKLDEKYPMSKPEPEIDIQKPSVDSINNWSDFFNSVKEMKQNILEMHKDIEELKKRLTS